MSPAQILADCDAVLRMFRLPEHPFEIARISALQAAVAAQVGNFGLVEECQEMAGMALRSAGTDPLTRDGRPGEFRSWAGHYRDPLSWAAFQLVGRVT
jgi:hypothetical protein